MLTKSQTQALASRKAQTLASLSVADTMLMNVVRTPNIMNVSSTTEPFSEPISWAKPTSRIKSFHVNESPEDLVVLSACWYRLRKTNDSRRNSICEITDEAVFAAITDEDRELATKIRDHFGHKFTYWGLTEVSLTLFREALRDFLSTTGRIYVSGTIPLVYKLPDFYFYDLEFMKVKERCSKTDIPEKRFTMKNVTLRPVMNLNRKLKTGHKHEYWLRDNDDRAYLVMIEHTNSCKSLWDREFRGESIAMNAQCFPLERDGLPYYKVQEWSVV